MERLGETIQDEILGVVFNGFIPSILGRPFTPALAFIAPILIRGGMVGDVVIGAPPLEEFEVSTRPALYTEVVHLIIEQL